VRARVLEQPSVSGCVCSQRPAGGAIAAAKLELQVERRQPGFFSLHAPLFFQEKHRQILQRSALDYASMNVHGFQVLAENGDPGGLFFIDFTPAAAAASRAFVRWRQTPEADALRPALPPSTRSA
jgi:hypothetical protein